MKLTTIDKNDWYTLEVQHDLWSSDNIPVITFELNNLSDETKYPIPNETTFVMSMEDAKQLHAFLGVIINHTPC